MKAPISSLKEEAMKHLVIGLAMIAMVMVVVGPAAAAPKIEGKPVEYTAGGVTLKGYLAYDENVKGKRPGVLVVHEWWGQNEYVRKRARMLAELGYTALALDMYGEGKMAGHPDEAGKFSSELTVSRGPGVLEEAAHG
jgi:dienelactone hydrolase